MTEKLYYHDAYIKEFSAKVISVEQIVDRYAVVLDRTAFFPEEGGQSADSGYIGDIPVIHVEEKDGIIYHYTERPVEAVGTVECRLNFAERYDKMQCHTAEHLLCGFIHKLYGFENIGFHLGDDVVTMDISGVLTREELDHVEDLANDAVFANVEVMTFFPNPEDLPSLEYRSKLDITENVRIVKIGEYDSCACCAPHVARTGEIGLIKMLDFEKHRGGIRIYITAGKRALTDYRKKYKSVQKISALLSEPQDTTVDGVSRLLEAYENTKTALKQARLENAAISAQLIPKTDGNLVRLYRDMSVDELREVSNCAREKVGGLLVLLSGSEGDYKYVISSRDSDLSGFAKEMNAELSGRGGGRGNMIQGTLYSTFENIEKYFEK